MKTEKFVKLYDGITNIKDEIIEEAQTATLYVMTDNAVPPKRTTKASSIVWKRIFASVAGFCLVALFSIGIWKAGLFTPHTDAPIQSESSNNSNVPAQGVQLTPFPAAPIGPNTDPLLIGDDGLPYVVLHIGESYTYYQISQNHYEEYGLQSAISENDFGELLGMVAKEESGTKKLGITSKEPSLIGASVYSYKPLSGKAAIIVKNTDYCGVFLLHDYLPENGTENPSFSELYTLFGVSSEKDISSLSYSVGKLSGSDFTVTEQGTVSDPEKISRFYQTSLSLPETDKIYIPNDSAGWEQINIVIHLKNGIVLGKDDFVIGINFMYKPNENGYLDYCEKLTPDQSKALRNVFKGN